MGYMKWFDGNGAIHDIERDDVPPIVIGDFFEYWQFPDPKNKKYLIDGMEGGLTPVGTFEKEI